MFANAEACFLRWTDHTDPKTGRQLRKWEDGVSYQRNWRQLLPAANKVQSSTSAVCLPSAKRVNQAPVPHQAEWVKRCREDTALQARRMSVKPRCFMSFVSRANLTQGGGRAIVLPARMRRRLVAAFVAHLMRMLFAKVPMIAQHAAHQLQQYSIDEKTKKNAPKLVEYYFDKLHARLQ